MQFIEYRVDGLEHVQLYDTRKKVNVEKENNYRESPLYSIP